MIVALVIRRICRVTVAAWTLAALVPFLFLSAVATDLGRWTLLAVFNLVWLAILSPARVPEKRPAPTFAWAIAAYILLGEYDSRFEVFQPAPLIDAFLIQPAPTPLSGKLAIRGGETFCEGGGGGRRRFPLSRTAQSGRLRTSCSSGGAVRPAQSLVAGDTPSDRRRWSSDADLKAILRRP